MIYLYIFVMAGVTYLIRMLPLTLLQRPIKSRFVRSFLYYVPYTCLTAMTFPAILYATESPISAFVGLVTAIIMAIQEKSLVVVAAFSCCGVFITERVLALIV